AGRDALEGLALPDRVLVEREVVERRPQHDDRAEEREQDDAEADVPGPLHDAQPSSRADSSEEGSSFFFSGSSFFFSPASAFFSASALRADSMVATWARRTLMRTRSAIWRTTSSSLTVTTSPRMPPLVRTFVPLRSDFIISSCSLRRFCSGRSRKK